MTSRSGSRPPSAPPSAPSETSPSEAARSASGRAASGGAVSGRSVSGGFDPTLAELVAILWQRRGVVLLAVAASVLVAVLLIGQWRQSYRAVAEVGFVAAGDQDASVSANSAEQIETAIAEIKSQDVLSAAASILRGEEIVFGPQAGQSPWRRFIGRTWAMTSPPERASGEAADIEWLRAGIDAQRQGNAAVIAVAFEAASPALGQRVLQTVIESFVWRRENRQKQTLRDRLDEMRTQLTGAQERLSAAEGELAVWQRAAGLLDASEGERMLSRIYELDAALEQAALDLHAAKMAVSQYRALDDPDDLLAMSRIAEHPAIAGLRDRYDQLRESYVALDQRYGPKHPAMIAKKRELAALQDRLRATAQDVARQFDHMLEAATAKYQLIATQRDDWQNRMAARHDRVQGQAVLLRAVDAARDDVRETGQRMQDLRARMVAFRSDVEILRPASLPAQGEFPTRRDLSLMAIMAALLIGVSAGMLRHYFDRSIHDDFDPEATLGIGLYARIPDRDVKAPETDKTMPASEEAIGHLAVLMRILDRERGQMPDAGAQVIALASAVSGEGKSHLASNLASALAGLGRRVLLVDADLRHPAFLGTATDVGDLTAFLSGEIPFEDGMDSRGEDAGENTGESTGENTGGMSAPGYCHLGARGPVPGGLATRLMESGMSGLLSELRPRFDHIVIDTPPILSVADGIVVVKHADLRLLVVRSGHSKHHEIAQLLDRFATVGMRPDGVVLTNAAMRPAYGMAGQRAAAAGGAP